MFTNPPCYAVEYLKVPSSILGAEINIFLFCSPLEERGSCFEVVVEKMMDEF
jgi:hypothetical protein